MIRPRVIVIDDGRMKRLAIIVTRFLDDAVVECDGLKCPLPVFIKNGLARPFRCIPRIGQCPRDNHVRPHHALGMRAPVPETLLEKPQISGPDRGG